VEPPFRPHPTARRLYPEVAAGGFTRHDGFIEFFQRINALVDEESVVLDFGAGRGAWADVGMSPFHRRVRDIGSHVKKVVGVDVDPVVLDNPTLSEAHVVEPGAALPFPDETFDVVYADYVLEHVDEADAPGVVAELHRVLKPGGWFAARTPNKWGVIGIGGRAVPNKLHVRVLSKLQPGRRDVDVFPTRYAMNTRKHLHRLFASPAWDLAVYGHASEPQYVGGSVPAWRVGGFIDRVTPPQMLPTLMVFAQRR
jgi:SAM-dependent methyltransferase